MDVSVCSAVFQKHGLRRIATLSLILAGSLWVAGCGPFSSFGRFNGVEYIAPRGHPGADRLIWSKTDPALILVNASEMGFGFTPSSRVFIWDRLTGQTRLIATTDNEIISGETWSPDGRQVVLNIPNGARGYENYEGLWIWNSETGSLDYLAMRGKAIWSPNNTRVAVIEYSKATGHEILRLIDLSTGQEQLQDIGISDEVGHVLSGDWAPDGQQLIFSIENPSSSIPDNLFTYNIYSRQLHQVTNSAGAEYPVMSQDGNKIAYIRNYPDTGRDSLHVLSLRTQCDIQIPKIDWISSVSWSPDGKKLAFVGPDGIYILDLVTFMKSYGEPNSCLKF
jgi:WD40 repeat protein